MGRTARGNVVGKERHEVVRPGSDLGEEGELRPDTRFAREEIVELGQDERRQQKRGARLLESGFRGLVGALIPDEGGEEATRVEQSISLGSSSRTMSLELMVAFHAASGAAAGSVTKSRLLALASGPMLHMAADRVPHRHPRHDVWEYATGAVTLGLLVRKRGLFDAATIGAIAAVAPDLEHLMPRKFRRHTLFHNRLGRDRSRPDGLSVAAQLALSAALLVPVLRAPRRTRTAGAPL